MTGFTISLTAQPLFSFFGVPITNALISTWLVMAALLLGAFLIGRSLTLSPGKLQAGVEMFFEYVLKMLEDTFGSRALATAYFPLIATIFIFILAANWFEFLPLIDSVTVRGVSLLHTPTTDLNLTLALALISFFVIEISGIGALGILRYGGKFVNLQGGATGFAVGLLEIVGDLARIISFSFRLFGAIFAGEVLLLVIAHFLPYIASVPFMAFEVFIGLLQAGVFAILTMAFIKIAITAHGAH